MRVKRPNVLREKLYRRCSKYRYIVFVQNPLTGKQWKEIWNFKGRFSRRMYDEE